MRCPQCDAPTLRERPAKGRLLVDVCSGCHGLWLDRGQIYTFSSQPRTLAKKFSQGLRNRTATGHSCPRCSSRLERGAWPDRDAQVEECPHCGGFWFEAGELQRAVQSGPGLVYPALPADGTFAEEREVRADSAAGAPACERSPPAAAGFLALPDLSPRSALTLLLLYGLLAIALITLVQIGLMAPGLALLVGVGVAVLQFVLGPVIMDRTLPRLYRLDWIGPEQLPAHLHDFVRRVCEEERMKFPRFGLIQDGAPAAFTYGHHPNNARVVISQGILSLLAPQEIEAVVAHELGHARNWDMVLMTVANLVPLLSYYVYRFSASKDKRKPYALALAASSYVLYSVSECLVLWFSRAREYHADHFAGQATGNPNALASALVKIACGLAARRSERSGAADTDKESKRDQAGAVRAQNIFDEQAAVGLVMASAVNRGTESGSSPAPSPAGGGGKGWGGSGWEHLKSAVQCDLWNPWAKFYELHSTHPLLANRLLYLTDQAAQLGQAPFVVFDRRQPEWYWDDFFVDTSVMVLPWVCFLAGLGLAGLTWRFFWIGAGLMLAGFSSLAKTNLVYRLDFFPQVSVAALLHKLKVSPVRPVPATLEGTIIGQGVPGPAWSQDFVLQDRSGVLLLDYRQPMALWSFLFGFRAAGYEGRYVRISGWFRRAQVPYLEVHQVEALDGTLPPRRCGSLQARLALAFALAAVGVFLSLAALG